MSIWDFIALITGILGVLLTIKQSIWCWPMALISVIISITAFYQAKLYGDVFLNIFYLVSGIYGWIYWTQKKEELFIVSKMPVKWIMYLIIFTFAQIAIYVNVLHALHADKVVFDSVLTALSFTATYMMTRKWLENWILWVIIDAAYIVLYLIKDLPMYAVLYAFFTLMAAYGFYRWKKQLIIT